MTNHDSIQYMLCKTGFAIYGYTWLNSRNGDQQIFRICAIANLTMYTDEFL